MNSALGSDSDPEICKYFDEKQRLCSVYSKRPTTCRVGALYEHSLAKLLPLAAYNRLSTALCNKLKVKYARGAEIIVTKTIE